MAVQSIRYPNQLIYRDLPRHVSTHVSTKTNGSRQRRSSQPINNHLQQTSSKIVFETSMQRAQLNQQYWEELLKRLRKGGGGGGSNSQFDRIAVSMMMTNFLANKAIQALLRNFLNEFSDMNNHIQNQALVLDKNVETRLVAFLRQGLTSIVNIFLPSLSSIVAKIASYKPVISITLSSHLIAFAFQLNKLKEALEEDFKEKVRKLEIKEKMKQIKTALTDFFVELKDDLLCTVNSIKSKIQDQFRVTLSCIGS